VKFVRFKHSENEYYGNIEDKIIAQWSAAPWDGGKKLNISYELDDVALMAPCKPKKIISIAINYPGSTGLTNKIKEPLVFIKPSSSIIGTNQKILSPFMNSSTWGESELGVLVGKKLKKATIKEAESAVFGYTIGNDITCNNINGWDHHLARSKAADTFCVLGPWIDTNFDPSGKYIRGYHNETLLREGFCQDRLWKEPDLLVWLSSWMTLEVGDIILTGAPCRVRDRMYFNEGDSYTCAIEGLGQLYNTFSFEN
jgi:2-keto-4-pentenoate hydratase/2-oxohepta-3-ene-1,7-dioic acid hydratase in catechol pathway